MLLVISNLLLRPNPLDIPILPRLFIQHAITMLTPKHKLLVVALDLANYADGDVKVELGMRRGSRVQVDLVDLLLDDVDEA